MIFRSSDRDSGRRIDCQPRRGRDVRSRAFRRVRRLVTSSFLFLLSFGALGFEDPVTVAETRGYYRGLSQRSGGGVSDYAKCPRQMLALRHRQSIRMSVKEACWVTRLINIPSHHLDSVNGQRALFNGQAASAAPYICLACGTAASRSPPPNLKHAMWLVLKPDTKSVRRRRQ